VERLAHQVDEHDVDHADQEDDESHPDEEGGENRSDRMIVNPLPSACDPSVAGIRSGTRRVRTRTAATVTTTNVAASSATGTPVPNTPARRPPTAGAATRARTLSDCWVEIASATEEFVAAGSDEPEEWRDVASLGNADLWLTVEETRDVTNALAGVLDPYRGRAKADRPEGSRRVRIMSLAAPHRKRR
jgi:hypothetical protein